MEQNVQVLHHPSYGPDSAPCDVWLLPLIKEKWAGWKFPRIKDLAKAVNSQLRVLSPSDDQNAFESWRRRPELCVRSGGEQFEGL